MYDLPVHNGQEPDDLHAFEPLALSPLGDVEQERVQGQEDKPDAYRVGQEKGVLERPDVDPGGRVEDLIQGTSFRRWVGRTEEEAYGETPPMIAKRSLMPAGNPCPVMK